MEQLVDVVIVGAGPVGLLSAIELTLAGVRVVVLERLAAPNLTLKAMGVGPLGAEALQRRGLSAAIAAAEARNLATMKQFAEHPAANLRSSKFSGHFAGLSLIRKDAQREPERRARAANQHDLEAMLAERARALAIELRREHEVTRFVEHRDHIDVHWATPTGEGQIRCSYLLGCDGGRSDIRKLAGFDFPGTPPSMTLYQVVADVDRPEQLLPSGWQRTADQRTIVRWPARAVV